MSILSGKSIPEGSRRKEVLKRKEQEVPALRKKARITNSTKEGEVPAQKSKIPMTRGANLLALSQEKKKKRKVPGDPKKGKKGEEGEQAACTWRLCRDVWATRERRTWWGLGLSISI